MRWRYTASVQRSMLICLACSVSDAWQTDRHTRGVHTTHALTATLGTLLGRTAGSASSARCRLFLRMSLCSVACLSLSLCQCTVYTDELCKNGWTDHDVDSVVSAQGTTYSPHGQGHFWARYTYVRPLKAAFLGLGKAKKCAVIRLNRSQCCFENRRAWAN